MYGYIKREQGRKEKNNVRIHSTIKELQVDKTKETKIDRYTDTQQYNLKHNDI